MSATVYIRELYNNSGSTFDFSPVYKTIKFVTKKTTDASVWSGLYGISKPVSGTNHSFWRSLVLDIYGTFTQFTNIRFYTSGSSIGTGISLYMGDPQLPTSLYCDPLGVESSSGYDMVGNHPNISSKTDTVLYTPSNAKVIDSTVYTSFGKSKHSVLQLSVTSSASSEEVYIPKLVWAWDEI